MPASPIQPRPLRSAQANIVHRVVEKVTSPTRSSAAADVITLSAGLESRRRAALIAALLAHVPTVDRTAARIAIPAILAAACDSGSNDPNRIGYLLATAQTESDFGTNMTETGHLRQWFNRVYGSADGNRPGTDDGYTFRGRGYVQTTHAGRYAELSRLLNLPDVPASERGEALLDERGRPKMIAALLAHPEKLAEPKVAAQALVLGVEHNVFTRNSAVALETTIPIGKAPGDVDFYHARGIVNGIVKSQAQTIATHATMYAQILSSYQHSVLDVPADK